MNVNVFDDKCMYMDIYAKVSVYMYVHLYVHVDGTRERNCVWKAGIRAGVNVRVAL